MIVLIVIYDRCVAVWFAGKEQFGCTRDPNSWSPKDICYEIRSRIGAAFNPDLTHIIWETPEKTISLREYVKEFGNRWI